MQRTFAALSPLTFGVRPRESAPRSHRTRPAAQLQSRCAGKPRPNCTLLLRTAWRTARARCAQPVAVRQARLQDRRKDVQWSGSRTMTLVDSVGNATLCATAVTGAVINYADATYCQVDGYYAMSATLDFPSIATLSNQDLTIAAPGGVTLTAGRVVLLGLPSNVPAGVVYNAFVTSGGDRQCRTESASCRFRS